MNTPAVRQELATRDDAPPPAEPVSESAAVFQLIERAARDQSIDLDRMERLIAMQERMKLQEAERRFNAAMAQAQAQLPQVLRGSKNTHNNSRYAALEAIAKAITPVVTNHGFSLSFHTEEGAPAGHYRLACTVAHRDGFSRVHRADLPSDAAGSQGKANKTAIQAFGSTMSYGRRYLTLLVFNIALTNEDDDGVGTQGEDDGYVTGAQAEELHKLVTKAGVSIDRFLAKEGIESLSDIPAAHFENAKGALLRKIAQREQQQRGR